MQALPGDSQKHAENYQLPDIGRLKKELPRQRLLYQEGSLAVSYTHLTLPTT